MVRSDHRDRLTGHNFLTRYRKKRMQNINDNDDLRDSPRDEARMKPDTANLDLPEVHDIPGQENITVPPMGELADVTASSDDEEGRGILDNINQPQHQDARGDFTTARNEASEDISNDPEYRTDTASDDLDEGELARFESGDQQR